MNTYWLIECPDYEAIIGRSHFAWLGLQSRGTPTESVHYHDVWVDDVHKAVRFCTKESAETVLSMLSLSPGNLVATEHEDASPPAAQEQKPVAELEVRNGIVSLKHTLAPIEQFYDGMKLYASPIPASGWVLVPREPTPEMIEAAYSRRGGVAIEPPAIRVVWDEMLAAAPVAPGETK